MITRKNGLLLRLPALQYFVLPLLGSIYPAVFHYANNTRLVLLSSFVELCILLAGIGLTIYMLLAWSCKGKFPQSAAGALLLLVFFLTYGFVFDWLLSINLFQVETYSFMPFWVLVALYLAWTVTRLNDKVIIQIWNGSMLILGSLILFNFVQIVSGEFEKKRSASVGDDISVSTKIIGSDGKQYPDIYFLIFDEAAGFEAIRQYWNYAEVDKFVSFLISNGFYVAENSHGNSTSTLYETITRLNYDKQYPSPLDMDTFDSYSTDIPNNAVMEFLKRYGYTLIAYDEKRYYMSTLAPVPVDHLFETSPQKFVANDFIQLDDYKSLVLENTMLRFYISQGDQNPLVSSHKDMILYTVDNASSTNFPSPKFVYVHLLLPHVPFAFKENGELQIEGGLGNWQKYLQNYKFFLQVAPRMVENILETANPDNPPVIIIQSDHGARNAKKYPYTGYMEDYPTEYGTLIINAFHLPNCDNAPLAQNMDPINTFPIVFNCYFDADIPIK